MSAAKQIHLFCYHADYSVSDSKRTRVNHRQWKCDDEFESDYECYDHIKLKRHQISQILSVLGIAKTFRVVYSLNRTTYRFTGEELLTYTLVCFLFGLSHHAITVYITGSNHGRMGQGCKGFMIYFHERFRHLYENKVLRQAAGMFPFFAQTIRLNVAKDRQIRTKNALDRTEPQVIHIFDASDPSHRLHNLVGFFDCKEFEVRASPKVKLR
jgi:hypothetical protein